MGDMASLPQYPRSAEEEVSFKAVLSRMHLIYGHWRVTVLRMVALPPGTRPLDKRGWPLFELAVASMKPHMCLWPTLLVFDASIDFTGREFNDGSIHQEYSKGRMAPLCPSDFDAALAT